VGYRVTTDTAALCYLPDHELGLGLGSFPLTAEWTSGHVLAAGVDLLVHDASTELLWLTLSGRWAKTTSCDIFPAWGTLRARSSQRLCSSRPSVRQQRPSRRIEAGRGEDAHFASAVR
jgi:hypothetical protein